MSGSCGVWDLRCVDLPSVAVAACGSRGVRVLVCGSFGHGVWGLQCIQVAECEGCWVFGEGWLR